MAPELIICGSLTIDNVVTAAGDLLPPSWGGNAVYAALGARLWLPSVGIVSRAGDNYSREFLGSLADRGLDLSGVAHVDAPHGMNVAFFYRPDGSRTRMMPPHLADVIPASERRRFVDYTTRGEQARFETWLRFAPDALDVPEAWVAGAAALHLACMPVQRQGDIAAAMAAARPRMHCQLDSPWYDERIQPRACDSTLLRNLDLILPSEADLLSWRATLLPLQSASILARTAQRPVLMKQGAHGCTLVDPLNRRLLRLPAFPTNAADPTGAGDAFCGGFLAGWRLHGDWARAMACGAASASFAVEARGIAGLDAATPPALAAREAWLRARLIETKLDGEA